MPKCTAGSPAPPLGFSKWWAAVLFFILWWYGGGGGKCKRNGELERHHWKTVEQTSQNVKNLKSCDHQSDKIPDNLISFYNFVTTIFSSRHYNKTALIIFINIHLQICMRGIEEHLKLNFSQTFSLLFPKGNILLPSYFCLLPPLFFFFSPFFTIRHSSFLQLPVIHAILVWHRSCSSLYLRLFFRNKNPPDGDYRKGKEVFFGNIAQFFNK